jgi:ubiquinone/menaquinone biosynthesis C-methylase UbiE
VSVQRRFGDVSGGHAWLAVDDPDPPSRDTPRVAPVFDEPARWRADVIEQLRLRGAERCGAASPGPGYPQLLGTVISGLDESPPGPWVDLGGGLGGVADWLQRHTRRDVIAFEPNPGSIDGARRLFPLLTLVRASAERVPLARGSVSGVVVSGVASLFGSLDVLVGEVARVLCSGGIFAATDLWSSSSRTVTAPPNTFWSIEDATAVARRHGFERIDVAISSTSIGWWSNAARQVDDVIAEQYHGRPGFEAWVVDREHIQQAIADELVAAGACVFRLNGDE